MSSRWIISILVLLSGILALSVAGCSSHTQGQDSSILNIASLTAEHPTLYPLGNTRIACVATTPEGSQLTYQWSGTDGKFIGSGSQVTWEAPKSYGDFHIMAMVDDGHGHTASKYITVTVIVRDGSTCCK